MTLRWIMLACVFAGCAPQQGTSSHDASVYIALTRDFASFRSWQRFEVDSPTVPTGHAAGPGFVYVNQTPPAGALAFPVGTILVKTIEDGGPTQWAVHAMAKRGGEIGLVDGGIPGWEIFELGFDDADELVILWRGETPPSGATYAGLDAGMAELACADCHATGDATANDGVLDPFVRLGP